MLFISTGIFGDKLRPQILSVGTTANAPLNTELQVSRQDFCKNELTVYLIYYIFGVHYMSLYQYIDL